MSGGMNGRQFAYGTRMEPTPYHNQDVGMSETLLAQQPYGADYFPAQPFPMGDLDDTDAFQDRYSSYQNTQVNENGLGSLPGSHFGSPTDDFHLPKSPVENIRTALNAPLPQSFDSNGVSHIAKYGPLGQSVPDKFGLRSPQSSSLSRRLGSPPDSISAFRNSNLASNLRNASPLGMSPSNNDESIGQRMMHSQRTVKPRILSASVPRSNLPHDWDDGFGAETDLLPNSLHDEVLTPQEKNRRMSRPEQEYTGREGASGLAIPAGSSTKVGSPPAAGSPSRFRALWDEQREKKGFAEPGAPGSFGHVGSPLRETWKSGETPDQARGGQISGISQAMARMQLYRNDSSESNGVRTQSSGLRHSSAPGGRFDNVVSSPGLTSRKIDEESDAVFFPMDDENNKRHSSSWLAQSPGLGPIRDRTNGELPRKKDPAIENGRDGHKTVYGFRP